MKTLIGSLLMGTAKLKLLILGFVILTMGEIYAQNSQVITGNLIDEKTNQPVPYASVSLLKAADQKLIGGTLSDLNGQFSSSPVPNGSYRLLISFLGYKPAIVNVEVLNRSVTDAGTIYLQDTVMTIGEANVVGERVKAKTETNKTTFFMTQKIIDASGSGTDVLKLIPGIQVDLMQNISIEGSRNILIFVDGKERDRNFISQLSPGQIDKVEIISVPPSKYEGNITGAINIVLKKDRDSGFSGQIHGEIPVTGSVVYIFPTFSFNYGFKNLNLYASYKGELTYLDLHESMYRKSWNSSDTSEYVTNQYLRQKNWSHRFTYGFDYFPGPRDMINFYAYFNPYSRELNGSADLLVSGSLSDNWQARKVDTDINISTLYSLYYKHIFEKTGREITIDISNFNLKAKNSTDFIYDGTGYSGTSLVNSTEPRQNTVSIKIDYTTPIGDKLKFSTGVKGNFQLLKDNYSKDFTYNEAVMASYGTLVYTQSGFEASAGLRAEKSLSVQAEEPGNYSTITLLPNASFRYKLNTHNNIQLSYNRLVRRPNIYELNPFVAYDDPYTVSKGNPLLKPEFTDNINLEYSIQFNSNYFSSRLFYSGTTNVINDLTFINNSGLFETQVNNLGTIKKYGIQFSGSLKFGNATVNPYMRFFDLNSSGNELAKKYLVGNRNNLAYESGLSAIFSFKKDFALSLVFQYNSPENKIEGNSYCDALYMLSIDKTFKQKIKVGIGSALPFTRSFIYQGSETNATDFYSNYKGVVNIPTVPIWLKLSYQFNSGKTREKISRTREEIDNLPKKGF